MSSRYLEEPHILWLGLL